MIDSAEKKLKIEPDFEALKKEFKELRTPDLKQTCTDFMRVCAEYDTSEEVPNPRDQALLFLLSLKQFLEKSNNAPIAILDLTLGYLEKNCPAGVQKDVWDNAIEPFRNVQQFLGINFCVVSNSGELDPLRNCVGISNDKSNYRALYENDRSGLVIQFDSRVVFGALSEDQARRIGALLSKTSIQGLPNWILPKQA